MASEAEQGAHTPGPWKWFGNARNHEVYLATTHSGRRYVLGFQRWGMRGAQPMFQPGNHGLVAAEKLLTFEVGDRSVRGVEAAKADNSVYRLDINGIDCADARLIAAAPDLLEALTEAVAIINEQVPVHALGWIVGPNSQTSLRDDALVRMRLALAKALGDTK